jgi:hypothetical protein
MASKKEKNIFGQNKKLETYDFLEFLENFRTQ